MKSHISRCCCLLVGLCAAQILGCGGGKSRTIEKFHVRNLTDPSAYVDVDAVVLTERLHLTYTFSVEQWKPYAELIHLRRIHIMRPGALHLRKVYIPFDATSGVLDVRARITHPDGSAEDLGEVKTLDFNRFKPSHPAAGLYNAPAAKVFAAPDLQVGDVLEYQYRRVIKDASWIEPMRIGGQYPVERGEVAITYPDDFDVDFRVLKQGKPWDLKPQRLPERVRADPNDSSSDGVAGWRLLWVFEKVPALYPEPLRPKDEALARQVQVQFKAFYYNKRAFRGFRDWNDVAKWYGKLIGDADAADSGAKGAVEQIKAKKVPKLERMRRINHHLAGNVVPIDFDGSLAALKVHSAGGALGAKAGDSKDLANAALGMLRAASVQGFPVLCSRRGSRALAMDLPTPEAFNSVVVAVAAGGDYRYFAPDGYGLPTGRLPWQVQGTTGLLIRRSGAELVELPEDKVEDNRREIDFRLNLNRDGSGSGNAVVKLTGQGAGVMRLAFQRIKGSARLDLVQNFLLGEGSKLTVIDVQAPKGKLDAEKPLKFLVSFRARELAKRHQGGFRFSTTDIIGKPLDFLWREGRRTALDLGYRLSERISIAVTMPDDTGVGDQPQDRKRDSELMRIDDRFSVADGQAWFLRERVQKVSLIKAEQYSELRSIYQALWQHQDLMIEVVPGGDRGKDYSGDPF